MQEFEDYRGLIGTQNAHSLARARCANDGFGGEQTLRCLPWNGFDWSASDEWHRY